MIWALEQMSYVMGLYAVIVLVPWYVLCVKPISTLNRFRSGIFLKLKSSSHEVKATFTSFLVLLGCLWLLGELKPFRTDLPHWWTVLSFPVIVLVHDAYFYWTHYLFHKSKFMYRFHKDHHLSGEATPLDVFAFHPVEAFVHFIFFVIYPVVIPSGIEAIQFMFIWMLVCNSAGHLPYEFYPKFLYDYPVLRECNAATHHLMHHKYYNCNFSIYYNWWDRWMGTNHKEYFTTFRKLKVLQEATDAESGSSIRNTVSGA